MRDLILTPRLSAIAALAAGGKRITDVGTDHGQIPVWLALHARAEALTATDIRKAPLQNAMRTAREQGVSDRIRFVLCDGLDFDGAAGSDTVIIAGMGGETVISILARAEWTGAGAGLILQPQTKTDELCVWLARKGYALTGALLVEDAGRLYVVLSSSGTGTPHAPIYAEDMLLNARDPLLPRWLDWRIAVLQRSAAGLFKAKDPENAAGITETLGRLLKTREETQIWQR